MSQTSADPAAAPAVLYQTRVFHRRHAPRVHELNYRATYLLVDVDALPTLDRELRLFGYNRRAPFSLHDRDFGPPDGPVRPLRDYLDGLMRTQGINPDGQRFRLLTLPRVLGRSFNPISVAFMSSKEDDAVQAVVYEVHNTFGERHAYVCRVQQNGRALSRHASDKALYVSPFFDMAGEYRFATSVPGTRLALGITYTAQAAPDAPREVRLSARLTGDALPCTDAQLARAVCLNPLRGVSVLGAIHFEALKLWLKRIPVTLSQKPPRQATGTRRP